MEVQPDFKELLKLLNAHKAEFIIVGAYALAFHGVPRFTGDMDILVKPDSKNAEKILAALEEFGFGSLDLTISDFQDPDKVVQLGVFSGKVQGAYGDVPVYYLGRKEFISNKKALGRKKDLADIEALGED